MMVKSIGHMAPFSCLLVLLLHISTVLSGQYYVSPSEEYSCPIESCITLSQFVVNSSKLLTVSSTVFLAPDNHSLHVNLNIANIKDLTMASNSTSTRIKCQSGYLSFRSIRRLVIKDLHFVGCQNNTFESVEDIVFKNSVFENHDVDTTVLHLIASSISIDNSSFMTIHTLYRNEWDRIESSRSGNKSSWLQGTTIAGIHSNITLNGHTTFVSCSQFENVYSSIPEYLPHYGGALVTFQSNVIFNGVCEMKENYAKKGGAIYATQSKLHVNGELSVTNNRAANNGGGIYLHQSELICNLGSTTEILENHATGSGGGIYAVSSFIKVTAKVFYSQNQPMSLVREKAALRFLENTAAQGGGLSLNTDSKLYIIEHHEFLNETGNIFDNVANAVSFSSNTANYGGALHVNDGISSESCGDLSLHDGFKNIECFFQIIPLYSFSAPWHHTVYFDFFNNSAEIAGSVLFGGQLDKCTISPFSGFYDMHQLSKTQGLMFFEKISSLSGTDSETISSLPVRLCYCVNEFPNCSYDQLHISVRKGEDFTVQLVAVDQVGRPVNTTVQGHLKSSESDLVETQVITSGVCTNSTFAVYSQNNSETLMLYALTNPCDQLSVDIQFLPCTCPIGFQPSDIDTRQCLCQCHSDIQQYVECVSTSNSFRRLSNVWISDVPNRSNNSTGYLIFPHCPFDYCIDIGRNELINLNQPNGSDAQCAFSRTGLLCGSCPPDLSLSLGSSRCLLCPDYWPVLFVSITLAAMLAGVALVAVVLLLNLTVAAGTLNALIFFANIVATHRSILLPFSKPNFITIFISWLNLEFGIDTCYIQGMDAYTRTWLQFVFPIYIIILVVMIIIICTYSSRFSRLIGKKNPVATLATLVLLSYAKFLQTVIAILSFGILRYPMGSHEVVWLHDPIVKYFIGKHSALFLTAVVVLLIGIIYTFVLLSWQWLLRSPKWWIFKWINNVKLITLMEAYHAPFTSKYRFWPGFLLLVRACLCLVDALNATNNPQVAFTSITFTIASIIILKGLIGSRIYKRWTLDVLEMSILFNLLFFAIFMWYTFDTDSDQTAVAYISVSATFVLLLLIIIYHVYAFSGVSKKLQGNVSSRQAEEIHTTDDTTDTFDTNYELSTSNRPTYSVVDSPMSL